MVVGNHQCNAANLNQSKPQFQLELSLAQFSPSLFDIFVLTKRSDRCKQWMLLKVFVLKHNFILLFFWSYKIILPSICLIATHHKQACRAVTTMLIDINILSQNMSTTRLSFEVFSLGKTLDFLDQNCFLDQKFFGQNFFFKPKHFFY